MSIIVTSAAEKTNYQVPLTIAYDLDMQSDFDDLRFTASNKTTLIDYWIESKTDSTTAKVWVEIPFLANGDTTIYMYYGNNSAVSLSNGENTFDFFDDFSGASVNTDKWTNSGNSGEATVSDGTLNMYAQGYAGSAYYHYLTSKYTLPTSTPVVVEARVCDVPQGSSRTGINIGLPGRSNYNWYGSSQYGATFQGATNSGAPTARAFADTAVVGGDGSSFANYLNLKVASYGDLNSTADYYINDVSVATGKTISFSTYPYIELYVSTWDAGSVNRIYVDWVLLRKYMASEPTIGTFGEEDSI